MAILDDEKTRRTVGCCGIVLLLLIGLVLFPWPKYRLPGKADVSFGGGRPGQNAGVKIRIELASVGSTFPPGAPVVVTVTLANEGKNRVRVLDVRRTLYGKLLIFEVKRDGQPLAPARGKPRRVALGDISKASSELQFDPLKDAAIELLPGARYQRDYRLNELFDMSKAGAYSVRAAYDLAHFAEAYELDAPAEGLLPIHVESEAVRFDIAARDDARPEIRLPAREFLP